MPPTLDHRAPGSGPTNPYDQESAGVNEASRWANKRSQDEPGLIERDRDERAQALGSIADKTIERSRTRSPIGRAPRSRRI
jgi:hypothetical protein